jgi:hypothetical protein
LDTISGRKREKIRDEHCIIGAIAYAPRVRRRKPYVPVLLPDGTLDCECNRVADIDPDLLCWQCARLARQAFGAIETDYGINPRKRTRGDK